MRKPVTMLLVALLILSGIGIGSFIAASQGQNPAAAVGDKIDIDTANVTGTGSIKVKPDVAYITLGVQTENKDAKAAQTENAKMMEAVVKAITDKGIKEDAIQTTQFTMNPRYDYSEGRENFVGYQVINMVTVRVKDINKTGDVLDAATAAGANLTQSIRFGVEDTTALYNQALEKAVANAKGKAEAIANAAGRKIDSIWTISEGYSAQPTPYPMLNAAAEMATFDKVSTPVLTGEMEITATVTASYRLK